MAVPTVTLSGDALQGVDAHLIPQHMLAALPKHVCLGRKRPAALTPTLKLSAYRKWHLATVEPPVSTNWRAKAAKALARMYLNDTYGDCVIAGKAHILGVWAANESGIDLEATDQEILSQYVGICGPNDQGCNISQVLDVMRTTGFLAGGQHYKIDNYVAVDWTNPQEVKVVQAIFGASTIGINLPQAWTQNSVWDVTTSRIVGGHDVTPIDYDDQGVYVSSWGRIYLITWAAFTSTRWLEEMWCLLSPLWYQKDNLAPNGIDVATLQADLAKLSSGVLPDAGPVPVSPPPVPISPPPVPISPPPVPPSPSPSPAPPTPGPDVNPIQQMIDGLFAQLEARVQSSSAGFFVKKIAVSALKQFNEAIDSLFVSSDQVGMGAKLSPAQIKQLADGVLGMLSIILAADPTALAIIAAIKLAVDNFLGSLSAVQFSCGAFLPPDEGTCNQAVPAGMAATDLGPPPVPGQWR